MDVVGKVLLYIITIVGAVGLSYCMIEFKYKRPIQALIFATAGVLCFTISFISNKLFSDEITHYYAFILLIDGIVFLSAVAIMSKDAFLKTTFAVASQVDALFMIVYISNTISRYFGENVWIEIVIRLISFGSIYFFYSVGLRKKYRSFIASSEDNHAWFVLVSIPIAFFILFVLITLFPVAIVEREGYNHFIMIFAMIAMGLTYWGIFYTFSSVIEKNKIKVLNEKASQKLEWWKQQIELQDKIIENSRQARHDLRHHDLLLMKMLKEGNSDKAIEYLQEHGAEIDDGTIIKYCQNYTVNCILTVYIERAKKKGIEIQCVANIPESINMDEVELSGLIANLLENAVEACEKIQNPEIKKYINITTQYQTGSLRILIENSCNQDVTFENGIPLSTKQTKSGIGIRSVQRIASQYRGLVDFTEAAGVFTARVLLNL